MKILCLCLFLCCILGCAGIGAEKKMTLVPDELSISVDTDPQDNWRATEVTGGLKWKLK